MLLSLCTDMYICVDEKDYFYTSSYPLQMKRLLLLAVLMPVVTFGQNNKDHASLVDNFVNYYNKQQTDIICSLFPDEHLTGIKCFWKGASTDGTYDIYGKIISYNYIGVDSSTTMNLTLYKIVFSKKGAMELSFTMNADKKFTAFRLKRFE